MSRDYSKQRHALLVARGVIDKALLGLAEQLKSAGVKELRLGNAKFDDDGFSFKLEGVFEGGKSREERDYELLRATIPELPPLFSYVKVTNAFDTRNPTVRVVGGKLRGQFNVLCVRGDGKRIAYRDHDIARLWAKQQPQKGGAAP